ncbi:MAG: aminotransferase class IV [Solirubrobacteraceae bacterium]|jgi:para-aminobenzoate synthetase/4-amino-4-deoxychorismate lyase
MAFAPPDPSVGVFETLLVRDGRVQALDAHLARLARSVADLYRLALPDDVGGRVRDRAAALAGEHRLRVDAVPAAAGLDVVLVTSPLDPRRPRDVACTPIVVAGGLGAHKWRDRRWLGSVGAGADVPLLVDRDGSVLEAAWANVWLLRGERLITPPADGRLLAGVTRARLLALAPALGLRAAERRITVREVAGGCAFLTSSLQLAAAISAGGAGEPGRPGAASDAVARIRVALGAADWT